MEAELLRASTRVVHYVQSCLERRSFGELSAEQDGLAVAEALSEAVLRDCLRPVKPARVLDDDPVLGVAAVDEAVQDALLAAARADRPRLHARENQDGRADLALETVLREVHGAKLVGDLRGLSLYRY